MSLFQSYFYSVPILTFFTLFNVCHKHTKVSNKAHLITVAFSRWFLLNFHKMPGLYSRSVVIQTNPEKLNGLMMRYLLVFVDSQSVNIT